jgi:hypothetical protein
MAIPHAARHYTLADKLDKVVNKRNHSRSLQAKSAAKRVRRIRKTNPGHENFKQ